MKKVVSLILFLLPFLCIGATFTVTSNAPSGPGTLFEALQLAAANGAATTDFIEFNLPASQTTIPISSSLVIPSNIIIDGTTQPGSAFGQSNAKVRLQSVGCAFGFEIDSQSNIEIYGLWFTDFNDGSASCQSSAISIRNTSLLTLGKPGKGNCFSNNRTSILNPWQLQGDNTENTDIIVQSNRFGMDTTFVPDYTATNIVFGASRRILIGGDNPNEGNRIGNGFITIGNYFVPLSAPGDFIIIKNNSLGFDAFNGPLISAIGINIKGYKVNRSTLDVTISNNKIGYDDNTNKITVTDIKGDIKIHNNYIGSLNTAVTPGDAAEGLYFENCEKRDSISIYNNVINGYKNAIGILNTIDVTISANSIYCNKKGINYVELEDIPIISFQQLTGNYLKGKATPFSKIEIFTTVVCPQYCENGKQLIASVVADINGVFEYSGNLTGQTSATATTPSGTTSEFYGAKFSATNAMVKNPTCNLDNGYIKGIKILLGTSFHWEDEAGNILSTDTSLTDLAAGKYRLLVKDSLSTCPVYSVTYVLQATPKPYLDNYEFTITNTGCSLNNGKITMSGTKSILSQTVWLDSMANDIKTGVDSIENIIAGRYYYKIYLPEDTTCFIIYGPYVVVDEPGPSLDTSQVQIGNSDCNLSNGSISNISVVNPVGSQHFQWEDIAGTIVGDSLMLLNLPAGSYRLKYKDSSICDTLVTGYFSIGVQGSLSMDSSQRIITASACTTTDGAIKNVVVNGADQYEWLNATTGLVIGNQNDLVDVPSGYYQLNASNNLGCKDTSEVMFVPQSSFIPISITSIDAQPAHCNLANGYVRPLTFSSDTSLYSFKWTDSIDNRIISNNTTIPVADSGSYYLMATDTNGCAGKIYSITVAQTGIPVGDYSAMQVLNDSCSIGVGAINNVMIRGGKEPYSWQWYKDNNAVAVATSVNKITSLKQGSYKAMVKDEFNCAVTSNNIVVSNFNKPLPLPVVDNQTILRNTNADLLIKNYRPGNYALYDTITARNPIRTTTGQHLVTPNVLYDKVFQIQYSSGSCVSALKPVLIKVFDDAKFTLSHAFSPNGDGINDVWKMRTVGDVTIKEWLVFNRYGQQVFSTRNTSLGWDGTFNGKAVPVGTYYWIVTAYNNEMKELKSSGSVVVLR